MGFPIRKSLDQSSFAAPQGLSQRTTSFIASQRQGIHRMPLRHLIALMIDVRRSAATDSIQKDHSPSNPSVRERACRTHPIDGSHEPCWSLGDVSLPTLGYVPSSRFQTSAGRLAAAANTLDPDRRRLVEPDGIEPTTSCLQSRRSPN